MKLTKIIISLALLSTLVFNGTVINAKNDNTDKSKDIILEEYKQMEEKINEQLTVVNNEYLYTEQNKEAITSIIKSFDVKALNQNFGTNYTTKTLTEKIINEIDTSYSGIIYMSEEDGENSNCSVRSRYCNRAYVEEGWNYNRAWMTEENSDKFAAQLSDTGYLNSVVGFGAGFFGPAGIALGAVMGLSSIYCSMLSSDIYRLNRGGCGTVVDTNKFVPYYEVESQIDF